MTWVKLDDGFAGHPKIEAVGPMAAWLHVAALCYCAQYMTDGHIPTTKAKRLTKVSTPGKQIERLVEAGLWDDHGDHYVIHDYLEYQPSAAEIRDMREKRAAAGSKGGKRSAQSRNEAKAKQTSKQMLDDCFNPDPTRPDPSIEVDTYSETHTLSGGAVCPAVVAAIEVEVTRRFDDRVSKGTLVGNRVSYIASIRDAVNRECAPAFNRIAAEVPEADAGWIIAEYDRRTALGGVA